MTSPLPDLPRPTRHGLRLEAPVAGDVVTVRLRPVPPQQVPMQGPAGVVLVSLGNPADPAHEAMHYRVGTLWRVLAVNAAHALVECLSVPGPAGAYDIRQLWSIAHHEWFEASELLLALRPELAPGAVLAAIPKPPEISAPSTPTPSSPSPDLIGGSIGGPPAASPRALPPSVEV